MGVLVAAPLAAAAITAGAVISKGETPRLRIALGGLFAAIGLSVLGAAAPRAARLFAGLVIIGTMLGPGYDLLTALTRLVNN